MITHTGTIRHCPRCREDFKGRYVPIDLANELHQLGAAMADTLRSIHASSDPDSLVAWDAFEDRLRPRVVAPGQQRGRTEGL